MKTIVVDDCEYLLIEKDEVALIDASKRKGDFCIPDVLTIDSEEIKVSAIKAGRRFVKRMQVTDKRKKNFGEWVDIYTDSPILPFEPNEGQQSFLTSIQLGLNIKQICKNTFYGLNITRLKLNNRIKIIPEGMCYGCSSLSSIEIPSSVKSIGYKAFAGCNKLSQVYIFAKRSSIAIDSSAFGSNSKIFWVRDLYIKFLIKLNPFKKFIVNDNRRNELFKEGERIGLTQNQTRRLLNSHFMDNVERIKKKVCSTEAYLMWFCLPIFFSFLIFPLIFNDAIYFILLMGIMILLSFFIRKKIKELDPAPPMGVEEKPKESTSSVLRETTRNITKSILNDLIK